MYELLICMLRGTSYTSKIIEGIFERQSYTTVETLYQHVCTQPEHIAAMSSNNVSKLV